MVIIEASSILRDPRNPEDRPSKKGPQFTSGFESEGKRGSLKDIAATSDQANGQFDW